jgi:uncharacterized membrane protein YbhN (UPF0104 family)
VSAPVAGERVTPTPAPQSGSTASRRRPRLFATAVEQPRSRRATDVILLVASLVGLLLFSAMAVPPPGIQQAFMTFVAAVPSGFDGLWWLLIWLLPLLAATLLVTSAVRRRWAVLRDLILAGTIALGAAELVGRIVNDDWPPTWESLRAVGSSPYFPPIGLAISTAITVTASPHLSKPARRLGRWLVPLAMVGTVMHSAATPIGILAAGFTATAAAAIVHLVFGSCMGRPGLSDVASALDRFGIGAHSLGAAERQPAGVFEVEALDEQDRQLVVKVYGRDAHDTQLLSTLWRTVWYREAGAPTSFGRRQQAEHEAFLTLLAKQAGVPTYDVMLASATPENDVLLVLRRVGRRLSDAPELWERHRAEQAWQTLRCLHETGIAHSQVDEHHLIVDADNVGLVGFRGAVASPSPEQMRTDQAQLLVTTALRLDLHSALDVAQQALGPDGLGAVLPFVQPSALTTWQRRAVREQNLDLDRLRTAAAEHVGIQAPELQRMRRVTTRSLISMALLVLAFVVLASAVADLDWALLADQVRDATWWLVIAGAMIAQTPRVSGAISTLGASPVPLPLGPVYALQLATSYIALAVPSSAARMAVNIRFFQRHGLRAGAALAIGALDGFAQFIVQALLLIGILLLTPATLDLDLSNSAPSGLTTMLVIIVAVAAAVAVALLVLPKARRKLFGFVRQLSHDALNTARGLRSPRRLVMLLGGNLATELLFAIALQIFVRALGYHVGLGEIVFINVCVSLLSGVLPVPGGIGVVEGGLTFGLVRAGVPEETAFAAVLLYRIATFYLPPIWGYFALRWLERNKHL